jgi:hypothetical protein
VTWTDTADASESWDGLWILRRGFWMDTGYWDDDALWQDGPDSTWSDFDDPGESWVDV